MSSPLAGGTHLPDITVITPIFDENKNISFYTASRGHHSEIGGILPGSMPASSTRLYEEGAQITSMFLVRDGTFHEEEISKALVEETGAHSGCSGTRKLSDNLNDLKAQIAANTKGAGLVQSLIEECGIKMVSRILPPTSQITNRLTGTFLYERHQKERCHRRSRLPPTDLRKVQRPTLTCNRSYGRRNTNPSHNNH